MLKNKLFMTTTAVATALVLGACGDGKSSSESKGEIDLAYVEWDTEVASSHVVGHVLEEMGYDVNLIALDNAIMWAEI